MDEKSILHYHTAQKQQQGAWGKYLDIERMKKENFPFYQSALKIWNTFYSSPQPKTPHQQASVIKLQYRHP